MSDQAGLPSPPPENVPPGDASSKAKKKKDKARKEWFSFIGRIVAQIIGAVASVALAVFFLQRGQSTDSSRTPVAAAPPVARVASAKAQGGVALAVLPLSNFSADPEQEYFADGMTEALTAELAQIKGLHVISRTSTLRYKTERKSLPQVAQELGVDFIVEGSVVKTPQRVRVTAQLIDAKSDEHVWARSYDRTLRDVLTLQAEVAIAIAKEVKGALAPAAPAPRRAIDPVVYDLYLRGRHAWALRTEEGFTNAVKYFTEATKRDPEFALAYAGLADAFSLFPTASLVARSVDNYAQARAAAEKAIALDDTLAEAHTSLAAVYFFGDRNFDAASREFERALALNANYPTAHQWYAIALAEQGKHAEAVQHAEEAVKEDPLNGVMYQAQGLVRYYARDFERAATAERRALQLNPRLPLARVVLAKALILQGKPEEAVKVCLERPAPRTGDVQLTLALAHARAGNRAAADAIVREIGNRRPQPVGLLVQWHAATGNHDTAFELMNEMSSPAPPSVLQVDPLFEGFRADRRFAERAMRAGTR